jgi:hypothetical protein
MSFAKAAKQRELREVLIEPDRALVGTDRPAARFLRTVFTPAADQNTKTVLTPRKPAC